MATDAELRRLRVDYQNILTRLEQISRSVTAKVSSTDTAILLRDVTDLLDTFDERIASLELYYNSLKAAIDKVLLASPTVIYPTTYTNPAAASTETTVTAGDTEEETYTADFPRRVSVSFSAGTSGEYVTITGTDLYGTAITESVLVGSSYTLYSFRTITEIDCTNVTDGTVSIGWSNWFAINCSAFTSIIEQKVNGVIETPSNYDADYGAIMFGTDPDGANDYEVVVVL